VACVASRAVAEVASAAVSATTSAAACGGRGVSKGDWPLVRTGSAVAVLTEVRAVSADGLGAGVVLLVVSVVVGARVAVVD
jgi:hypothetical protein